MSATTLHLHLDTLALITIAAHKLNTSKRDIIVRLLKRMMKEGYASKIGFSYVKYQPSDPDGRWHCFTIKFKVDENEFFSSLRNILKLSVSYMVAIAAKKYLTGIKEADHHGLHNNVDYCNYVIHRDKVDGVPCWRLYWGFPLKHLETLLK